MVDKAKYELDLLLGSCEDDTEAYNMQMAINNDILDIVKLFASQGHSGYTASYSISIIDKLLKQSFILPLTGEDDEWVEVATGVFQNKRESRLFKDANKFDGKPYNIEAKIFSRDGGKSWVTNRDSHAPVEFPMNVFPEPERIILSEEEETDGQRTTN